MEEPKGLCPLSLVIIMWHASRLMAAGKKIGGNGDMEEEREQLGKSEAIIFAMPCPNCHTDGEAVNCVTDIPYFKVPYRLA